MKRAVANSLVGLAAILLLAGHATAGEGQNEPVQANAEPDKSAGGKRANDEDIRYVDMGHYIGGINRDWGLFITPPPMKRFHYWFTFSGITEQSLSGTYEIKDGLAIFTGKLRTGPVFGVAAKRKVTTRPLRFGLNYTFLGDKVHFNLLVPDKDGSFHYRRKWFRQVGGQWKPREEHKLTFIPGEHPEKALVFAVKGQRLRWDKDGHEKRDEVEALATYQSHGGSYYRLRPGKVGWLPPMLWPGSRGNNKKGQPAVYRLSGNGFGQTRGFTWGDPPK